MFYTEVFLAGFFFLTLSVFFDPPIGYFYEISMKLIEL